MYTRFYPRAFGLLPASLAAAALLLAAAWGPLPAAAQTDPTATPSPTAGVTATAEPTIAATATSTAEPTATGTAAATATVTPTATVTAAVTATATPEPAATLTPAPASTVTPTDALTGTVRTSAGVRLRVRSGPGSNYPIVTRLSNGQTVTLLGRNASGSWLLVGLAGQSSPQGWVSATYLSTSAAVADLPAANAAPAPAG